MHDQISKDILMECKQRLINIEYKENRIINTLYEMLLNEVGSYEKNIVTDKDHYDFGVYGMWFTKNYGAILTSYAISSLIIKAGYSALLIDLPVIGGALDYLDNPGREFMKSLFDTTPVLQINELHNLNAICSSYIVPSDSLWGGGYAHQFYTLRGCLLGECVPREKNMISFSTSFGAWNPKLEKDEVSRCYMEELLKRFSHISMRERSGVSICKNIFHVHATWTLDPVFLLPCEKYVDLIEETVVDEHYIFAYILQPLPWKIEQLKCIVEKLGLRAIFVPDLCASQEVSQENISNENFFDVYSKITVNKWCSLLYHADMVVTDSYHGMCFSLIFNKQFVVLNPRDGMSRFSDLAEYLGIHERFIYFGTQGLDSILTSFLDYDKINGKLSQKIFKDTEELNICLYNAYINAKENTKMNFSELRKRMVCRRMLRELM